MTNWFLWLIIGLLIIAGGISALYHPFLATLTAERIAAWVFIGGGILQLIGLFRELSWSARLWQLLLCAAFLFLGLSLLLNPLAGIVSLTLTVAILLLVSGVAKLIMALSARGTIVFWPVLLSGLVSAVLALIVFANFPQSAAVLLGVLLAVELLSTGFAIVAASLFVRRGRKLIETA